MSCTNQTPECCNNKTNGQCCHESVLTDDKAARHIIDAQDEYYHDIADSHVFMMHGLLVAKDVVMPKPTSIPRDKAFDHINIGNC